MVQSMSAARFCTRTTDRTITGELYHMQSIYHGRESWEPVLTRYDLTEDFPWYEALTHRADYLKRPTAQWM